MAGLAISIDDICKLCTIVYQLVKGFEEHQIEIDKLTAQMEKVEAILKDPEFQACFTNDSLRQRIQSYVYAPLQIVKAAIEKYTKRKNSTWDKLLKSFYAIIIPRKLKAATDTLRLAERELQIAERQQAFISTRNHEKDQKEHNQRQEEHNRHEEKRQEEMNNIMLEILKIHQRSFGIKVDGGIYIPTESKTGSEEKGLLDEKQSVTEGSIVPRFVSEEVTIDSIVPCFHEEDIILTQLKEPANQEMLQQILKDESELNQIAADYCNGICRTIMISYQSFKIIPSSELTIQWDQKLGEGTYGIVYLASRARSNQPVELVAVKRLLNADKSVSMNELILLHFLRNKPHVVNLYGCCNDQPGYLDIVMEYCTSGSLQSHVHRPVTLLWPEKWRLALEIAQSVATLHRHQPPIYHRDIKSLNFVLDDKYHVKVCDFGMSRLRKADHNNATLGTLQSAGTTRWLAPEIAFADPDSGIKFNAAVDMYSVGIVLIELATQKLPYFNWSTQKEHPDAYIHSFKLQEKNGKNSQLLSFLQQPQQPPIPEEFSQLIEQCCCPDPQKRPTATNLVIEIAKYMAITTPEIASASNSLINDLLDYLEEGKLSNAYFKDVCDILAVMVLRFNRDNIGCDTSRIPLLLSLLNEHPHNPAVVLPMCGILLHLLTFDTYNIVALCSLSGVETVLNVIKHQAGNLQILQLACDILWSLSNAPDYKYSIAQFATCLMWPKLYSIPSV